MVKLILYADRFLSDPGVCKTAYALIRFRPERVALIFSAPGSDTALPEDIAAIVRENRIPISDNEDDIDELVRTLTGSAGSAGGAGGTGSAGAPPDVLIGFAPIGGKLLPEQKEFIDRCLAKGLRVVNGMHSRIDHPLARNLRHEPYAETIATDRANRHKVILTVGTDHSNGKMTATVLLHDLMKQEGMDVEWLPTGQTGKMIHNRGHVLDAIPVDFVPGVLQDDIDTFDSEYLLVEGQGSVFYPAYSPTSFALFHASKADFFVLCHRIKSRYGHFGNELPSLAKAIEFYTQLSGMLGFRSQPLFVSLNSMGCTQEEYLEARARAESETGLMCLDMLREAQIDLPALLAPLKAR